MVHRRAEEYVPSDESKLQIKTGPGGERVSGRNSRTSMKEKRNSKNPDAGADGRNGQTFAMTAPAAMSVQWVGDFTHRQHQPIQPRRGSDGVWRTTVQLQTGRYHYRFLVDGQWRDDPECTLRVPNPYASQNSVRQVA